jgi:hypothetical protein
MLMLDDSEGCSIDESRNESTDAVVTLANRGQRRYSGMGEPDNVRFSVKGRLLCSLVLL